MSEVTEIEYFDEKYPGLEFGVRGGFVVDQVVARVLVDAVLSMEFWSDGDFVPETVEAVGVVDKRIHEVSVTFSGSLSNSLSESYCRNEKGGINTRCSLAIIRGDGEVIVRVHFGEEDVVGCDHEFLRYLDANTTECIKCEKQVPNSHVIREHL